MTLLFHPDDLTVAEGFEPGLIGRAVRQLLVEAAKAHGFGKPRAAALMEALARVLPIMRGPVFARIDNWPGDLASDGVIFRLNAGLHALALERREPGVLRAVYENAAMPSSHALDAALAQTIDVHAERLLEWLSHPTQTNEVARAAGLVASMLELGRDRAMPCEVLELGASAGLNLNLAHYRIALGDRVVCAASSPVALAPEWRGRAAAPGVISVTRARGVDLHPLDVANDADRHSLAAYVWPGEAERAARLEAAIAVARQYPPQVDHGLGSKWLAAQLGLAQASGTRRVVFHSMVLQYADAAERTAIDAAFAAAGARAAPDRPLARVGIEWRGDRGAVEIRITRWDGSRSDGESRLAGECHPYGEWIEWHGLA